MHDLSGGPSEPQTHPTLVAELSVVNTEARAMPRNAVPPSSLAALGEEGCSNFDLHEDVALSTLHHFGVVADSDVEPCLAVSNPVLAVDDQRAEGSQIARSAARNEWNHLQDAVVAAELVSGTRVGVRI